MEADRTRHDPALTALVGELSVRDADFRTWWATHHVRVQQFTVDTHPDQLLVAYTGNGQRVTGAAAFLLLSQQPKGAPQHATPLPD